MFRLIVKNILETSRSFKPLLNSSNVVQSQLRNLYILKRKFGEPLYKEGQPRKKLRSRHYVYEVVKDTSKDIRPPIDVILTQYVKGLGDVGDIVSVEPFEAYNRLLVPQLAVYASPRNREKYKHFTLNKEEKVHSSKHAQTTVDYMQYTVISVVMNKDVPWTLKAWHVKASFRKAGFTVPEDAITMPEKEICGPNLDMEGKQFYVTVTINNLEQVKVRCNIHHWSTKIADRLPHELFYWKKPVLPVFEEEFDLIRSLPNKHTEEQ